MTTQKFKINTIQILDHPPIEFRKVITLIPENRKLEKGLNDLVIDLHQIEQREGEFIPLRDKCKYINLDLTPEWTKSTVKDSLTKLIFNDEHLEEIVVLNVILLASDTRDVIDLKKLTIGDIESNSEICFSNIDVNKYHGKIEVQSNISRIKGHATKNGIIADRKHFILGVNKNITIYLDEVSSIGSNYLDIIPEDLGRLLFRIRDWQEPGIDHPQFLFNSEIEKYVKGGDYFLSIQNFLMMGLIIYSDFNLKWILFSENFSESDEYHLSIVDFISKILDYKKADILNLAKLDIEDRLKEYFKLSKFLLEKIQDSNINYKTKMKEFIDNDLKNS
jgi:hypothetical protein